MGLMKSMSLRQVRPRMSGFVDLSVDWFFDRPEVMRSMDDKTRRLLIAYGKLTRSAAKKSMSSAPQGVASAPGTPPHKHRTSRTNKSGGGLFKSILYAYDPVARSAVVGPSSILGRNILEVGARNELGLTASVRNQRRKVRRVGGGGEIKVGGSQGRDARGKYTGFKGSARMAKGTLMGDVRVVYVRLRTERQAARANRLNEQLYGPMQYTARYDKRPFLLPALEQAGSRLPYMWRSIGA